ncbi:TetR/AcrR family transcriptional regulator [Saccharomonospora azurea]|uniref:TetR/AcrR family transcriptional regulator n=1 Tax=Saccharomonospora azurea TaxID=40988 RepID=UPI0033209199
MRCAQCGSPLVQRDRGRPRRYCGRACQARAYRARRDGGAPPPRRGRSPSRTGPATPLTRADIVANAIELADAEGLSAVSLRRLAAHLGVAAMSLYHHIGSRSELVTAMVDAVFAEIAHQRPPATGWRERIEDAARQEWALYRRHPWLLRVLATSRPTLSPSMVWTVDHYFTALDGAGLDRRTQLSLYLLVSGYVQGMALLTVDDDAAGDVSGRRWWAVQHRRLSAVIDSGRYPWLTELFETSPASEPTAVELDRWFGFGLDRVLDGVGVFLETSADGRT